MELRKFIGTTIREYLNEQKKTLDNVWYHGTDKKFNEFYVNKTLKNHHIWI